MKDPKQIEEICQKVLSLSKSKDARAEVGYYHQHTISSRFAENAITQNMSGEEESLHIKVVLGKKHGSSITNKMDENSLAELVNRAISIAQTSPDDPELVDLPEPQIYQDPLKRYREPTQALTPIHIAEEIKNIVQVAESKHLQASGLLQRSYGTNALYNSNGLVVHDPFSWIEGSTTMHGPAGSGYATKSAMDLESISFNEMAITAALNADLAQNPSPIEPGKYTVIMEPTAVNDLLNFLIYNLDARDAEEGTSVFANKLNQKIFSDKITMETKWNNSSLIGSPFGEDGIANRDNCWVENGVLTRLKHNRYWAEQKHTNPDPSLFPFFIKGEDQSINDLIKKCDHGLLIKRLWYIRYVDKRQLKLTGMTRDGLFLIKNGSVVKPLKNLRFNDSPINFLKQAVELSKPETFRYTSVPGIMSKNFNFSSKTESI